MMDDSSEEKKGNLEEALWWVWLGEMGIFGVSKFVESVDYKQNQETCHRFFCSTYYLPLAG